MQQTQQIRSEIASITAWDTLEQRHRADALAWVDSGAPLVRVAKPATPPQHLVSYFVVMDGDYLLLVDHKNAQLWLPGGGHVEQDEHPRHTVQRELQEELGFTPQHPIASPRFISISPTVGLTAGHTDVSLWYVVHAPRTQTLVFDRNEFHAVRWFHYSEIAGLATDPHLQRFVSKYRSTETR